MHSTNYKNLTQDKALELFDYKDGVLYWKKRVARREFANLNILQP